MQDKPHRQPALHGVSPGLRRRTLGGTEQPSPRKVRQAGWEGREPTGWGGEGCGPHPGSTDPEKQLWEDWVHPQDGANVDGRETVQWKAARSYRSSPRSVAKYQQGLAR